MIRGLHGLVLLVALGLARPLLADVSCPSSTAFASSDAGGGPTTASAPVPTSLASGELWIIVAVQDSDTGVGATLNTPSGFTAAISQTGSNATIVKAWYKYATGSDSAVSVTGTHGYVLWGVSIRCTGIAASSPIGSVGTPVGSNTTPKTVDAPDITIAANGSAAIMAATGASTTGGVTAVTVPSTPAGITSLGTRDGTNVYPTAGVSWVAANAGSFAPGTWSIGPGTNYEARVGVTFEVKPAAATPATLSSPTPSGTLGTSTTATIGATTDTTSGTFYAVVDTDDLTGITNAQIRAPSDAGNGAVVASCMNTVSTTTPSCSATGLTASTTYNYAVTQNTDGNVQTGSFTTAAPSSTPAPVFFHHLSQQASQ